MGDAAQVSSSWLHNCYIPLLKSKNGMLKIDDMKVPGRKNDPINVKVFIDALSRPLLFTKRFC